MKEQAGTFEEKAFLRGKVDDLRISSFGTKDAPSLAETSAYEICQERPTNKNQNCNHLGPSKTSLSSVREPKAVHFRGRQLSLIVGLLNLARPCPQTGITAMRQETKESTFWYLLLLFIKYRFPTFQ